MYRLLRAGNLAEKAALWRKFAGWAGFNARAAVEWIVRQILPEVAARKARHRSDAEHSDDQYRNSPPTLTPCRIAPEYCGFSLKLDCRSTSDGGEEPGVAVAL